MSRNFVIGDLHGRRDEMSYLSNKAFPEQKKLTKEDVLFQLGDFGLIWYLSNYTQGYKSDEKQLDMLSKKNFTLFIIPGNHDNYDIINKLPLIEKWNGMVYEYKTISGGKIYLAKRGETYLVNGKKIFTFSGATTSSLENRFTLEQYESKERVLKVKRDQVTGNIYRQKYEKVKVSEISYWPQELATEEEKDFAYNKLNELDFKVDYILTHTAPPEIIAEYIPYTKEFEPKFKCETANFLSNIYNLIEAKEWHFGHLHRNGVINKDILFECHYMTSPKELI